MRISDPGQAVMRLTSAVLLPDRIGKKDFWRFPLTCAVYYLSRSVFADEEIYAKDDPDCWNPELYEKCSGLLDERLSLWLDNIDKRGYLTEGSIERL